MTMPGLYTTDNTVYATPANEPDSDTDTDTDTERDEPIIPGTTTATDANDVPEPDTNTNADYFCNRAEIELIMRLYTSYRVPVHDLSRIFGHTPQNITHIISARRQIGEDVTPWAIPRAAAARDNTTTATSTTTPRDNTTTAPTRGVCLDAVSHRTSCTHSALFDGGVNISYTQIGVSVLLDLSFICLTAWYIITHCE